MPLDRDHITKASRIMLPAYVALAVVIGTLYVLDPQDRLGRNPGLALARQLLPMWVWGLLFLAVGATMAFALWAKNRGVFVFALYVYMVAAVVWAGIYLGACFLSPAASYVGPVWPLFVAVACKASARSLKTQEV